MEQSVSSPNDTFWILLIPDGYIFTIFGHVAFLYFFLYEY